MRFIVFLTLFLLPVVSIADTLPCDYKQTFCKAECKVSHLGDEAGLRSCEARCLGERAACSLKSGTESAKKMGQQSP